MVDQPAVTLRRSLTVALLFLAACGSNEDGDLAKVPGSPPGVLGNGSRLSDLNDPAKPRPAPGAEVFVSGVAVVAVDTYDETQNGSGAGNIYVQDVATAGAPPPYGGITLFDASFNPPSLRVAPGDVVDVRGAYEEFPGPPGSLFEPGETLPEIVGGSITLRFEYAVPEPIVVPIEDFASYETGRKWIGMLVKVENVVAAGDLYCGPAPSSGSACDVPGRRHSIELTVPGVADGLPTVTNALSDIKQSGVALTAGTEYASIVGIAQYFFNFSIAPRSAADIQQK